MSSRAGNITGQEQLFVTAMRPGGDDVSGAAALDLPDEARAVIERDLHEINVLQGISDINARLGYVAAYSTKRHRPELEARYGREDAGIIADAMPEIVKKLAHMVKFEFARSIGMFDQSDQEAAKEDARQRFEAYCQEYDGTGKLELRNRRIAELRKGIEQATREYSELKRASLLATGSAPLPDTVFQVEAHEPDDSEDQLDTPARQRAIYDDPRAGFLPHTNAEKNRVLAFLDYMDNPRYDYGIVSQFDEIAIRREREFYAANGHSARGVAGEQALVSITHELADYYENARDQIEAMKALQQQLAEPFAPTVTLLNLINQGELDMSEPGFAPLVRHIDHMELLRTNSARLSRFEYLPLRTVPDRAAPRREGSSKAVEDRYTGNVNRSLANNPNDSPVERAYKARIRKVAYNLTAKEARELLTGAIFLEQRRAYFMESRLANLLLDPRAGVRAVAGAVLQESRMAA